MPAFSYYSSADPFIIPEEISPDYFFLPRSVEPRGSWDHSSREFPYDKIPKPAPVRKDPRGQKGLKNAPKRPRASASGRQQTPAMIRPVKAKGNWDYSAREFTHDRIPPLTPVRRGRKKNAEWVPRSVEPRGNWDHLSREFPYDKIPKPAPVRKDSRGQKGLTNAPKKPRASAPGRQQTPAMIRPVKAKGNWDYSAREFTHDRIPPPTPVRRGRK